MTNPSLTPPPDCRLCSNSRHVYRGDSIVRCRCVLDYVRGMEYQAAGVSPMHFDTPIGELVAQAGLTRLAAGFSQPLKQPFLGSFRLNRVDERRIAIASAALRLALDAGRSARFVSLDNCIASRFSAEERPNLYREFEVLDTLVVDLDVQVQNKMVPQLCMDIFTRRASRTVATVFLAADDVAAASGRYGPEFALAFSSGRVRNLGGPVR